MDISLFKLREKFDKFLIGFGLALVFTGFLFLLRFREYYFIEILSQLMMQLGLAILIVDLFLAKLGNQLQQEILSLTIRKIIGISKNKKLISELNYINKPTGYQVIEFHEKNRLYYNKKYNI